MIHQNKPTTHIALAGMCLAISVVMPTVFHFAGPQGGKMFLPLFWGVAIAALLLPLKYAIMVGLLVPALSYLASGMPPIPMLYFMTVELAVYATALSIFRKKFSPMISILLGLLVSRTAYILTVSVVGVLFHLPPAFSSIPVLIEGILISVPGILAQALILPMLYHIYGRILHP